MTPPTHAAPLRALPARILDKWRQPVAVSPDGRLWRVPDRPEVTATHLLNWLLYADARVGDTPVPSGGHKLRRRRNGADFEEGLVSERPEDGRRRVLSARAVAVAQLYLAESAAAWAGTGMVHAFKGIRRFVLWLAAHPEYLPDDGRPFEWGDLTPRVVRAFLARELATPNQGGAVSVLRTLLAWGTHPESALPDFDEALYAQMRLLRLPNRARPTGALLADPRRGAFDADELATLLDAVETFEVGVHAPGAHPAAALRLECGRATVWTLLGVGSRPVQLAALTHDDLVDTPLVTRDPTAPRRVLYHLRVLRAKQPHGDAPEYDALPIARRCGELLRRLRPPNAPGDAPLLWWLRDHYGSNAAAAIRRFLRVMDLRTRRLPRTRPPEMPPADDRRRARAALDALPPKVRAAFQLLDVDRMKPSNAVRLTGSHHLILTARLSRAQAALRVRAPGLDVAAVLRAEREAADPRRAFRRLPVTVYRFRYGLATDQIRKGASMKSVARFLGHADTQVVDRYVENTPDIADEFQRATDWALVPLTRAMRGRVDDPANPSAHTAIPGAAAAHLARGRNLPVIGPIGKCGRDGNCPKQPVVSCFTCNDYIARPDGAATIRELRAQFVAHLDGLGADASDVFVMQLRRALRAMEEWIAFLEEVEAAAGQAAPPRRGSVRRPQAAAPGAGSVA